MRRNSHYTVRFPDPVEPSTDVYLQRFAQFPFWYRWYLRLRALVGARSVVVATRAHHLQELRRRLDRVARSYVDCSIPALLPAFHRHVRSLQSQRRRIRPALDETTGSARGTFLRETLETVAPELTARLHDAADLPDVDRDDPGLSLEEAQHRARRRIERSLEEAFPEIERRLAPIWSSLRTLNLLQRVDLDSLLPVQGARREQTPLRVVREQLQQLYQVLELCHRNANPEATEQAWAFAHRRIRAKAGPPRAIWSEIEEFRAATPFVDLVRFAAGEPFLEIPALSIRSDWWTPFRDEWTRREMEGIGPALEQQRQREIGDILSRVYLIDRPPVSWIPTALHPRTVGFLLLLAGSDFFDDTRRVVTQLVIDAQFYHLDTRNRLHQAALQLDQALERLRSLLGGDDRGRGTLGDEIQRLQQRSGSSSLVRRQLTGLYERYRPRVRASIEETIDSLETAGTLIARTQDGTEVAYVVRELHSQSFSGDYAPRDLLDIVGSQWRPLARQLRGLYRLENDLSGRSRSRDPDIPDAVQ